MSRSNNLAIVEEEKLRENVTRAGTDLQEQRNDLAGRNVAVVAVKEVRGRA